MAHSYRCDLLDKNIVCTRLVRKLHVQADMVHNKGLTNCLWHVSTEGPHQQKAAFLEMEEGLTMTQMQLNVEQQLHHQVL